MGQCLKKEEEEPEENDVPQDKLCFKKTEAAKPEKEAKAMRCVT